MPKLIKEKLPIPRAIAQDFPFRLAELETELRSYPALKPRERALKRVKHPVTTAIGHAPVIRFEFGHQMYAAGHADMTYSGSNHARGTRHIRFYAGHTPVLDIEGDYENQELGANFNFQTLALYAPGHWEDDFLSLSEALRRFKSDRRHAFQQQRAKARRGR